MAKLLQPDAVQIHFGASSALDSFTPVSVDNPLPVSVMPATGGVGPIPSDALTLCLSANSTQTGTTFAALTPTVTAPAASASRCVITWVGRENLVLIPFGRNANNLTMKLRVTAWLIKGSGYYPRYLAEATCTQSSALPGASGQTPSDSDLFCDTITVGGGIAIAYPDPTGDTGIAWLEVPIGPADLIEVQFIRNGSATEVNSLYSTF
jgi:hypothetical protein